MVKVYQAIANALQARKNCEKSGNAEWFTRHGERIEALTKQHMPHGSGFDCGVLFDFDASKVDRLVFTFSFHHMDEFGGYDGWSDHCAIVRPSLVFGFDLRITGRDKDEAKAYFAEIIDAALNEQVDPMPAIDEPEQIKRGELVAEILQLGNKAGRYLTTWGDKTALGLYLTVKRIVDEGE